MPKKTKREKIIAEYHRKLSGLDEHPNEAAKPTYTFKSSVQPSITVKEETQTYDLSIKKDLVKTLILAAFAIGGEIALSITLK